MSEISSSVAESQAPHEVAVDTLKDETVYPRKPERWCDLVMKGGVTSAIVYPLAICELARAFRFKNIGGTSAGAIASAGAAAAELRRQRDNTGQAFAEVAGLPNWVGSNGRLLALLKPQRETAPLFNIFAAATDQQNNKRRRTAFIEAIRGFKLWALVGALISLPIAATFFVGTALSIGDAFSSGDFGRSELFVSILLAAVGLIATVLGGLAGVGYGVYRRVDHALPKNFYGLTTGFGTGTVNDVPRFTVWLTGYLNKLAGLPEEGQPLTFGDLWGVDRTLTGGVRKEHLDELRKNKDKRLVNLEIMTTCLTLGRPYRFPQLPPMFYFSPQEFRKLFPENVVQWMEEHPGSPPDGEAAPIAAQGDYSRFPDAVDIPVVVATRMSISSPPLISAVPLGAIDFTAKAPVVERCWFSDGGLTSNFPVHFFDAPVPRWPTVAINLRPFGRDEVPSANQCENVKTATSDLVPTLVSWNRFENTADGGPPEGSVLGFFGTVLQTLQNWTDNLQIIQPGYFDRIAHVLQAKEEGGSNLRMESETIVNLAERGRCAGEKLRTRFAEEGGDGTGLTWKNHRYVRFRRTMASLESYMQEFSCAWEWELYPGDEVYPTFLSTGSTGRAPYTDGVNQTISLLNVAQAWQLSFKPGAPVPENQLRLTPPHDYRPYEY